MLIENYLGRSAVGESSTPAPAGDALFQITETVFTNGINISNVEVFRYKSITNLEIKKVAVQSLNSRLSGIASFQFKKNGTNITTALLLNNSNPLDNKITGLSTSLNVDDELTVELTTTDYAPINSFKIIVEVQK